MSTRSVIVTGMCLVSLILMFGGIWSGAYPTAQAGVGIQAPEITSEVWLNSQPLKLSDLRGKVVMVEIGRAHV